MITSTYSSQSPSSINFLLIAFLVILIIGFAVYGITNKYGSKIPDNRQKLQLNQHNGVRSFNIPRFCQYCGNRVQKNDLFCENCGNRL